MLNDGDAAAPATQPEEGAWNQLYRTNSRPLYRYLLRLTLGNRSEAEDHLQETFLRVWRRLQGNAHDLTAVRPLLFTVARHIAIDAGRSRRSKPAEVTVDDLAALTLSENEIERFILAHTVRCALRALSLNHRAALIELYYHERTAQEAADVLGVPEGTVKSRAHYALRALRVAGVDARTGESATARCDKCA